MIPITLWYRQYKDKDGEPYFVYNHWEDHHLIEQLLPSPRAGRSWTGKFEKIYGHRTDELVPVIETTVTIPTRADLSETS